ncbi:MAG: hypothetical protein ACTSQA_00355 [Candidatus Heimdallarchaeaceae archaeon]
MIKGRTDYKRNNKIGLRNFKEASDLHDCVKTQLVRMLRRKHKDNHAVPIYTEHNPERPNEDYPDIWMRVKKDIIVYEIQHKITKNWTKQILEKYEDVDLIIVPLKEVLVNWRSIINKYENPIDSLREVLEVYVV